jgi:hypothetical protein
MYGSKECHTGYIYQRVGNSATSGGVCVNNLWDPSFVHAITTIRKGVTKLKDEIETRINNVFDNSLTRSGGRRVTIYDAREEDARKVSGSGPD